ncbi:MAG: dockerin type I repeat-containing protein, partial [Planctomycetota bacterium]
GQTPGVGDLNCDPIFGTTNVAVAWSNPIFYDSIEVTLNGTVVQTLSGTDTFTTVTGVVGTREICVIGIIGGVATDSACCTVNTSGQGDPPITIGDPNGDGAIDIGDAIAMLGYLFSQVPINCVAAMDVNGDGSTDISDPIYELAYLFSDGPPPVGGGPCAPNTSSLGCDNGGCG